MLLTQMGKRLACVIRSEVFRWGKFPELSKGLSAVIGLVVTTRQRKTCGHGTKVRGTHVLALKMTSSHESRKVSSLKELEKRERDACQSPSSADAPKSLIFRTVRATFSVVYTTQPLAVCYSFDKTGILYRQLTFFLQTDTICLLKSVISDHFFY